MFVTVITENHIDRKRIYRGLPVQGFGGKGRRKETT
jgi:hypothetical protein